MTKRRLPPIENIIELLNEGLTVNQIGQRFGVTKYAVYRLLWRRNHRLSEGGYNSKYCDAILDFIIDYKIKNDGNSPSYREIAKAINKPSINFVWRYIKILEDKGKISLFNNVRGIIVNGGKWLPPSILTSDQASDKAGN
jgi:transposase